MFSQDDVIDYMVAEACVVKWYDEQDKLEEKTKQKEWQKDFSTLEKFQ